MIPHKLDKHRVDEEFFFLVERPGLDVVRLGGGEESLIDNSTLNVS